MAQKPSKMGPESHPKPSQDASLGRVKEAIANFLFLADFLTSFWEPSGSHLDTFGSHVTAKGRLGSDLAFHVFFYRFLINF